MMLFATLPLRFGEEPAQQLSGEISAAEACRSYDEMVPNPYHQDTNDNAKYWCPGFLSLRGQPDLCRFKHAIFMTEHWRIFNTLNFSIMFTLSYMDGSLSS